MDGKTTHGPRGNKREKMNKYFTKKKVFYFLLLQKRPRINITYKLYLKINTSKMNHQRLPQKFHNNGICSGPKS